MHGQPHIRFTNIQYFIDHGYYEHTYGHDLLFIYFVIPLFMKSPCFLPFNNQHLQLFARLFLVCSTIISLLQAAVHLERLIVFAFLVAQTIISYFYQTEWQNCWQNTLALSWRVLWTHCAIFGHIPLRFPTFWREFN